MLSCSWVLLVASLYGEKYCTCIEIRFLPIVTSHITVRAIILNYKTENLTLFRETMINQYIKQCGQNVAFLKVKSK